MDVDELKRLGAMVSRHRKQLRDFAVEYDGAFADVLDVDVH